MPKFIKKAVVIEAKQWNGTYPHFRAIINPFCGAAQYLSSARGHFRGAIDQPALRIQTLEGEYYALPGDWIIKDVKGEFYPCKPDIFAATYEEVEEPVNA